MNVPVACIMFLAAVHEMCRTQKELQRPERPLVEGRETNGSL